jgi:hypothetical protein
MFQALGAIGTIASLALKIMDFFGIQAESTRKWLQEIIDAQAKPSEVTQPADDEAAQEAALQKKREGGQ